MTTELISTTYAVTGMTCENCVKHVTSEFMELDGVHDVDVALNVGGTSQVTVRSEAPLPAADAREAIEEAGYALES